MTWSTQSTLSGGSSRTQSDRELNHSIEGSGQLVVAKTNVNSVVDSTSFCLTPPSTPVKGANICGQTDCTKRVSLAFQQVLCRCDKIFCDTHRPTDRHDCLTKQQLAALRAELDKKAPTNIRTFSNDHGGGDNVY